MLSLMNLSEPDQTDGDAIGARIEEGHAVAALLVRGGRGYDAGGDVEDFNGRAGNGAAAGVDDAALKRAPRFLSGDSRGKNRHGDKRQAHDHGRLKSFEHSRRPWKGRHCGRAERARVYKQTWRAFD